jgi:hypothetical protein
MSQHAPLFALTCHGRTTWLVSFRVAEASISLNGGRRSVRRGERRGSLGRLKGKSLSLQCQLATRRRCGSSSVSTTRRAEIPARAQTERLDAAMARFGSGACITVATVSMPSDIKK